MISKLLSLLSTAKGAAAATVIAAAGVGGGVLATNTDVQNAIGNVVQNVTQTSPNGSGQPAVVAARNDADKRLREAFQDDQKKLESLRGTKVEPADRSKLEDTVKTADDKLRARLDKALNDVAALTLGREGLVSGTPKASASASPTASASASPSASPRTLTAATQAQIDAIVTAAIADMNAITSDAEKAAAALPTANPGRPSDAGKPSGQPSAKPSDAGRPSDAGKPSGRP